MEQDTSVGRVVALDEAHKVTISPLFYEMRCWYPASSTWKNQLIPGISQTRFSPQLGCSATSEHESLFLRKNQRFQATYSAFVPSPLYTNSHHQPGYVLYKDMWQLRLWELSQEGTHKTVTRSGHWCPKCQTGYLSWIRLLTWTWERLYCSPRALS